MHFLTFESVSSTMDVAARLAQEGVWDNTWILAERQTHGRGQRGNVWRSLSGNLHASWIVRAEGPAWIFGIRLALMVGRALEAVLPNACLEYKWPNDILVHGKKIAGVLIGEPCTGWRVGGVGVNLQHVPDGTAWPATSCLREGAPGLDPETFCKTFVWKEAPASQWLAQAYRFQKTLSIKTKSDILIGKWVDLSSDGGCILERNTDRVVVLDGSIVPPNNTTVL